MLCFVIYFQFVNENWKYIAPKKNLPDSCNDKNNVELIEATRKVTAGKLLSGGVSGAKVDVKNANLKGNMNESGGFVLKGPMAMLALSALCLVVMMGFYYFYNQFKRSSKSYTVVVNKGG